MSPTFSAASPTTDTVDPGSVMTDGSPLSLMVRVVPISTIELTSDVCSSSRTAMFSSLRASRSRALADLVSVVTAPGPLAGGSSRLSLVLASSAGTQTGTPEWLGPYRLWLAS